MTPIEVQLVGQGFDWLALWQTIGTVGAIPASVFGALWVQDLGRRSDARHRLNNQTLALIEIGERCVASVGRLHKRANAGTFKRDELGWLTEDAAAIEANIGAINLMEIASAPHIKRVAELHEAARTARRRLGYNKNSISRGGQPRSDLFDEPYEKAEKALKLLKG